MAEEGSADTGAQQEAMETGSLSSLPKDAQVIASILKDMGVTNYEPRVISQLLEFVYRYVTEVLDDAKLYSSHAGNTNITREDVKFAIQTKLDHTFTGPPPRDFLVDLAQQKNNTALPTLKTYTGARLPPDRYCLSAMNYRLKSQMKHQKNDQRNSHAGGPGSQQSSFRGMGNQMSMPVSAPKRKWDDDDDYDM